MKCPAISASWLRIGSKTQFQILQGKLKQDSTWNVDIDFVGPNGFKNAVSHTTNYGELKMRDYVRR